MSMLCLGRARHARRTSRPLSQADVHALGEVSMRGEKSGKGILVKTSKQGVREICLHDFQSSHKTIFVPHGAVQCSMQSLC